MDDVPGAVAEEPVERFRPTTGIVVGWLGIVFVALVVGYVVLMAHSLEGLRVALLALLGGVVVHGTQIRPRVTAYRSHLIVHGSVRDVSVPYRLVDDVVLGQTLNIWVGGRRIVCVGIGRTVGMEMRGKLRTQSSGFFGVGRVSQMDFVGGGGARPTRTAMSYQDFVVDRLKDLVAAGRAGQPATKESTTGQPATGEPRVTRRWVVSELVALGVLTAAVLVAFLV